MINRCRTLLSNILQFGQHQFSSTFYKIKQVFATSRQHDSRVTTNMICISGEKTISSQSFHGSFKFQVSSLFHISQIKRIYIIGKNGT